MIKGLYAIIDTNYLSEVSVCNLAEDYLRGGVRLLQLRQKDSDTRQIRVNAEKIVSLKKEYDFTFIVNDDPIVASEVGADGVHLGQEDMSVLQARKIIGPDKIIGLSTHSLEEAQRAQDEEVDYIACGAIFPTPTKGDGHPVVGLETLREVVEMSRVPVVAIGGINRSNIGDVLGTGVDAVAMISALGRGKNRIEEVEFYIEQCAG